MKNSAISWTDHTFNPWEGCTKVSPGCAHCYAETRTARFGGGTAPNWGPGAPRRRTSAANWAQVKSWDRVARWSELDAEACGRDPGPRPRVFCASLADWLDEEVPIAWLADLLNLIDQTPCLDWLLLTKRPQNWYSRVSAAARVDGASEWIESWTDCLDMPERGDIPANVWVGTTVEDQQRAAERIPHLLAIPARVRFLSCEPLLGPVDLRSALSRAHIMPSGLRVPGLWPHWVICGGESGPEARPMHPEWPRTLRDQCAAAGVPFHFKQWGEWSPKSAPGLCTKPVECVGLETGIPPHQRGEMMFRVGKRAAGRLLDGIEHNAFPDVQP